MNCSPSSTSFTWPLELITLSKQGGCKVSVMQHSFVTPSDPKPIEISHIFFLMMKRRAASYGSKWPMIENSIEQESKQTWTKDTASEQETLIHIFFFRLLKQHHHKPLILLPHVFQSPDSEFLLLSTKSSLYTTACFIRYLGLKKWSVLALFFCLISRLHICLLT